MRTFFEWMEYAMIEPFGEDRADLRAGIISSTLANCLAGGKGKKYKPSDFMPKFERKRQTGDEIMKQFGQFARVHNAMLARKRKA